VDLEREINADIDGLVDLNRECVALIKEIPNLEHQALLEMRYLRFKTWGQIAKELGYSIRSVYRLHNEALKNLDFFNVGSGCHFYSPTSV
jgi:DNA-directed RNA polymerase specialized sigma subunit